MAIRTPEEERYSRHSFFMSIMLVILCFLAFAGGTVAYVTWAVNSSEHKWCSVIGLLNEDPAPSPPIKNNPSREYDTRLSADFRALKGSLGC